MRSTGQEKENRIFLLKGVGKVKAGSVFRMGPGKGTARAMERVKLGQMSHVK